MAVEAAAPSVLVLGGRPLALWPHPPTTAQRDSAWRRPRTPRGSPRLRRPVEVAAAAAAAAAAAMVLALLLAVAAALVVAAAVVAAAAAAAAAAAEAKWWWLAMLAIQDP